jgi:hypothetical protein
VSSYAEFSLPEAVRRFDLTVDYEATLFPGVASVPPSAFLTAVLEEFAPLGLAIGTEKSRSEFIIAPILAELRRLTGRQVSLFSGVNFDVDVDRGLNGFCDFILSRSRDPYFIEAPVLAVVEAKNEDIRSGLGQCVAAMVGAQVFNERAGREAGGVYGAVTTGTNWRFLRLVGTAVAVDRAEELWTPVDRLLGILLAVVTDRVES